jgi:hypothetical protein
VRRLLELNRLPPYFERDVATLGHWPTLPSSFCFFTLAFTGLNCLLCIFLVSFWKHARVWILYRQGYCHFLGFGYRTKQSRYVVMAWRWDPNLSPERSVVFTVYFWLALWISKQQVFEANNPKSVLANNVSHTTNFEVRHSRCVSQNHKIKQQTLESQNTTIYIYIYIYMCVCVCVCVCMCIWLVVR